MSLCSSSLDKKGKETYMIERIEKSATRSFDEVNSVALEGIDIRI